MDQQLLKLYHYKPYTPSLRFYNSIRLSKKFKITRLKHLLKGKKSFGGRNHQGIQTVYSKGHGNKNLYRSIKHINLKTTFKGIIISVEYDPNRSNYISLVYDYLNKKFYYLPYIEGMSQYTEITNIESNYFLGTIKSLKNIDFGIPISNITLTPNKNKAQLVKSAGTYAMIIQRKDNYSLVRLPSKEYRFLHNENIAIVGSNGNSLHQFRVFGKAGISKHRGIKPSVRGVVMNPIDHPHGGGEGKSPVARPKVSPWGKLTQGVKTRSKKKPSNKFILNK